MCDSGRVMARAGIKDISSEVMLPQIILVVVVLGLTLFGCVMVYSASAPSAISESGDAASYLIDQIKFVAVGLVAAVVVFFIPYRWWRGTFTVVLGVAGLIVLIATAIYGLAALGAQRWIVIGPISLQPSEFVKIVIILNAAKLLADLRAGEIDGRMFWAQVFFFIVLPLGLILVAQSDLGTTAILFVGIVAAMWLGEVPLRIVLIVLAGAICLGLLAIGFTSYRSSRLIFLDPWNDGEGGYGSGYQMIHSYYAFSQGGLFGVGLGNSREKYAYLPESETDFIFSIIGEELGMVGALLVIIAFLVILWMGMHIARSAYDDFGAMLVGGLVVMLVFQAFLNIACAIGVFPTTGKPLPFISSGGSSLVASFMMVGLILSVANEAGAPSIYRERRENLRVVRASGPSTSAAGGQAASRTTRTSGRASSVARSSSNSSRRRR